VSRDTERAEITKPTSLVEATCFRQGRSGASRDIAATVLRRAAQERFGFDLDQIEIKIKCKASATKAAGYFLLS
jgi:hypothetical protein